MGRGAVRFVGGDDAFSRMIDACWLCGPGGVKVMRAATSGYQYWTGWMGYPCYMLQYIQYGVTPCISCENMSLSLFFWGFYFGADGVRFFWGLYFGADGVRTFSSGFTTIRYTGATAFIVS